jgi:hypothetical protein
MEQLSEQDRTKNVMDAVVFLDVLTTNMKVRDSPDYVVAVKLVERARNEAMAAIRARTPRRKHLTGPGLRQQQPGDWYPIAQDIGW